jgi:two-component system, cell cycle response regulator DivK
MTDQLRALIVDDSALNVELARFMLEAAHFEVHGATDGVQALASLGRIQPDVILMDIQMPVMDGMTLTRHLKADPKTASIVIVAFTAYAMRGDEARMREAGCDAYIAKPVDVQTFVPTILAALAKAGTAL